MFTQFFSNTYITLGTSTKKARQLPNGCNEKKPIVKELKKKKMRCLPVNSELRKNEKRQVNCGKQWEHRTGGLSKLKNIYPGKNYDG